ncbi:MAG TPA: hypothetical protein VHW72_12995 [Candidatus Angelobacter sp.]|nr:hypothetical protein [Candidatus Angelobacter sp.]
MPTTSLDASAPATTPTNVLYVVLHGLISMVDIGAGGFIAYLLDMKEDHVYLYGDWLTEQDFPTRGKGQRPVVASLQGVDAAMLNQGTNTIDPALNVVVKVQKAPPITDVRVRAVLNLPRPQNIRYCISGTLLPNSLKGAAGPITSLVATPPRLCGIRIFEYTFDDATKVQLLAEDGTKLWACPEAKLLAPIDNKNIAVLHVYDEPKDRFPDEDTATKHNQDEFNLSFAFLGVPLELVKVPQDAVPAGPMPGLDPGELDSLDQREAFVLNIMFKVRCRQDPPPSKGSGGGGQICSPAHAVVTTTST